MADNADEEEALRDVISRMVQRGRYRRTKQQTIEQQRHVAEIWWNLVFNPTAALEEESLLAFCEQVHSGVAPHEALPLVEQFAQIVHQHLSFARACHVVQTATDEELCQARTELMTVLRAIDAAIEAFGNQGYLPHTLTRWQWNMVRYNALYFAGTGHYRD